MALISVEPYILENCVAIIDGDDYAAVFSKVLFEPNVAPVKWKGLTPSSNKTITPSPDWTVALDYPQDWDSVKSFSRVLFELAGTIKPITFRPRAGAGARGITANIVLAHGPIGGTSGAIPTGSVKLGITGTPVWAAAA